MSIRTLYAIALSLLFAACLLTPAARAQTMIVADGKANAQIVIAKESPRIVPWAAKELQTQIHAMTGVTLPIVHEPAGNVAVSLYVGKSSYTDKLDVNDQGLDDGAYRIVTGDQWMVLLGNDEDFTPIGPYSMQPARDHPDRVKMMAEWDKLGGGQWGSPFLGLSRTFNKRMNLGAFDKKGSFNAVTGFLRDLGMEWYMPGELGQVTPRLTSIALPEKLNRTVKPDFGLRALFAVSVTLSSQSNDDVLWALRLGANANSKLTGPATFLSHGLTDIMDRDEMKLAHPEYYALWNGKRMNEDRAKPCLSSEGLIQEAVKFARAMFDVYDIPMVSIMPQDGYGNGCECELCAPRQTPERGMHGSMSDYLWGFANRVASEVYKTHPDKKISCYAYGTYLLPPTQIKHFSPNLVVGIVHGRSGKFRDPATRDKLQEIRQAWVSMTDNPLLGWEHYVFTHRGTIWPAYFPRETAAELKAVKGENYGDVVEVASAHEIKGKGHSLHMPGFNHLNVFTTARYFWDADQNIDAFLDRYYNDFYGPAAAPMKAFIEASHGYWRDLQTNHQRIPGVLDLFEKAKKAAPPDSIYGQRVALVDAYLNPLRNLRDQLERGREGVPEARVAKADGQPITLDGKLDEPVWQTANAYALRELQTGKEPAVQTQFRSLWQGGRSSGSLYIAIECAEPDMANMPVKINADGSNENGIWGSDNIELLIETQGHSYYQIVIAPNGAVVDIDRRGGINFHWASGIEVKASQNENSWTLELRIPVMGNDMADDPVHDLVAKAPVATYPWHINVCRQRLRESGNTVYAWSPTGTKGFHEVMKFGKLYMR